MMVCIGKPRMIKFLSLPGCGEKWDHDFPDGKCPICRGELVPESYLKKKEEKHK